MDDDARYEVIWLVRRLFQALGRASGRNLSEAEISVAQRAVLEFLYPDQCLTMSSMARKYDVTRQHLNVLAHDLIDKGLIETRPNPESKRAPLLSLTARGRKLFQAVRRNEGRLLDAVFSGVSAPSVKTTGKCLRTLLANTHSLIDS